jgi:hypothetical protein
LLVAKTQRNDLRNFTHWGVKRGMALVEVDNGGENDNRDNHNEYFEKSEASLFF